jgi:hypothetical protein
MQEAQIPSRLRKQGYLLRKRDNRYMIVDAERNYVVAGGEGDGYSMSLNQVADYCDV